MATGELTNAVIEEVADELELAAVATRRLDGRAIGFMGLGVTIGIGVGFYLGYRYSKKKLRKDIYEEAEAEFEAVREHYRQKIAGVVAQEKPSVEKIVKERGYQVVEENVSNIPERPLPPPVPGIVDPRPPIELVVPAVRNDGEWDYEAELANRSDDTPCILHRDEFENKEGELEQSSLIYYQVDGILVDEDDKQDILTNVGELVGDSLDYFGHGSGDPDVVFVRNPVIEHEFEITRVPLSWEEEVLGLDSDADST